MQISCFTKYDIRGQINVNINSEICYRISRAFCEVINAKTIVVGHDARETSPSFADAVIKGARDAGVDVLSIGLSGTEEMYWATNTYHTCGGISITASHNPLNYNGLKVVKSAARPIDPENELKLIHSLAEISNFKNTMKLGTIRNIADEARFSYTSKILTFLDIKKVSPIHILVNSGNGAAGPTFKAIASKIAKKSDKIRFTHINSRPDHTFPNGIPNPSLPENQTATSDAIIRENADFGIAFDGDFDRCFFFDEKGEFIPVEFIIGLLTQMLLEKSPKENIIHDCRIIFNIEDTIKVNGGRAIQSKTGHGFFKQIMRTQNAIYGGELSSHHYFRDFGYCDSGMIPWLLITELVGKSRQTLSELIADRKAIYHSSGEINLKVKNPDESIKNVLGEFENQAKSMDFSDGLSLEFNKWRFNLRASNTEPLLRLCVESKNKPELIAINVRKILSILDLE